MTILDLTCLSESPILCTCDVCGEPAALPSYRGEGAPQNHCSDCAAELGKYDQAYAQLDLLVEDAVRRWLHVWGHEPFTTDLGEHLGELGDRIFAAARARLAV